MKQRIPLAVLLIAGLFFNGCVKTQIKLFTDGTVPFEEYTLEGTGDEKILLIPVEGTISDSPKRGWLRDRPGLVENVVAQLRKAEKDPQIKALVLKINSPGGAVTASDILYHELQAYRARRQVKIVALFMGLAASGGYYVALPADHIVAHPTSITGSVGVIFIAPPGGRPYEQDRGGRGGQQIRCKQGYGLAFPSPHRRGSRADSRSDRPTGQTLS